MDVKSWHMSDLADGFQFQDLEPLRKGFVCV